MASAWGKMPTTSVRLQESYECEHAGLRRVHQLGELRELATQLIGDDAPLGAGGLEVLLGEDGIERREHDLPLSLAGMSHGVSQELHFAALRGIAEDLSRRGLQSLVRVRDHQCHSAQSTTRQEAHEVGPERFGLARPDSHAGHFVLALGVHGDADYHGLGDDAASFATLNVGRIDPQVRPAALQRTVEERMNLLVVLAAQPADLKLVDPAHAHRLDQLV